MGRLWTAPNLLTLSRIPLGFAFWRLADRPGPALAVLSAAAFSDLADGWLARKLGQARPRGIGDWLDPVCDKFFVLSALLATRRRLRRDGSLLRIAARELVLVPLAALQLGIPRMHARVHVDWRARSLGKVTTAAQFAATAGMILARRWASPLAASSAVLGLLASFDYLRSATSRA